MPDRVLILGGTAEAAAVARQLAGQGVEVVNSFAGRLPDVPDLPGETRVGGFGGAAGLADYLREAHIDRVIDATHPFASTISAHAAAACAELGVPLERLWRPEWTRRPGDRWHWADDTAMAARMAAKLGRRVLLTVGVGEVGVFARNGGPLYVVRLIVEPGCLPLPRCQVVLGRGPFTVAGELALMRAFRVDLLVTKASGGAATEAKLTAARKLRIPVVMIRRPRQA
jgi:precorrin-6A/cobalt-precorrin-6A reductase